MSPGWGLALGGLGLGEVGEMRSGERRGGLSIWSQVGAAGYSPGRPALQRETQALLHN